MRAMVFSIPSVRSSAGSLLLCAFMFWAMPLISEQVSFAGYMPQEEGSFETADLAGTWDVHALNEGHPPARLGWSRFVLSIDDRGNAQIVPGTYLNSSGETDAVSPATMTVAEDGILSVTFPAGETDNRNAHGVLSRNKQLAVMTMDDEGGCGLSILQKRTGVVFSADDMAGTWSMHAVGIGVSPDFIWEGWTYGDMTVDAEGTYLEVPGSSLDSSGYSPGVGSGTMTLTSEGLLGIEGWPSMHGTLSGNMDLAVYTHTDREHPSDCGLSISQRRSSIPLTRSDLSGLWHMHGLSTEAGTWANWVYGTWTVNADGASDGLLYKSDGTTEPFGGTVTVASYGVFRIDPFEHTHGVMGSDRDLIVLVTTDSDGEHQMLIGTRAGAPAPYAGACPCEDDDPDNGIYRVCNYLPLNPGNQWIYTTGDYTVLNEIYLSSYGWSAVRFATRTYEYDGFIQNCENGLAFVAQQDLCDDEFDELDPPIVLIPPEMQIGESVHRTYTWSDGYVDRSNMTTTLIGPETITVPAGEFSALRFDIDVNDVGRCTYTTRLWLVKDVGMVKIHRVNPSPADCGGCIFMCRCDGNLELVNAPAELVSAVVDGKRY